MKEGWEYKKIKDIGSVIGGTTPNTNIAEYWDGNLCWISPAELDGSHYLYDSRKKITEAAVKAKSLRLLPEGTVILSSRAPIGKVVINKVPTYCNQGFKCVVCDKEVYNEFLYWWFWGKTEFLNSLGTGATFKEISKKVVEEILIPVPPFSEQQSIVDYLDSAFAKIDAMKANAEKALNEAKALFQASLKEMLEPKEGWEEKALKDLGQTQTGTTPSKSDKSNYGDYIEFIRPSEIDYDGNGRIDYNCEIKLSEQGASKGRVFASNSILMVCIGATIGKVGFSIKEVSCNQQINVFTPSNDLNYKFVYYAMRSPSFQLRVIKEGTSSQATLPIINKGKWEQLSISFPEIKEQEVIATHLDNLSSKVSDLKENYDKISQECDALKQAILRQVFE